MKNIKHYFLVTIIFLISVCFVYAQEVYCPLDENNSKNSGVKSYSSTVPTSGNYKALIVFVKFKDDNGGSRDWPVSLTSPPSFANNLLSTSTSPSSFPQSSATEYFYKQSNPSQRLTLYGEVYNQVLVTDKNEAEYNNTVSGPYPKGWGTLVDEIMGKVDGNTDPKYNLANYDANGDGDIDYLFIVLRGTSQVAFSGCANLQMHFCGEDAEASKWSENSTDLDPPPARTYDGKNFNWGNGAYLVNNRAGNVIPAYYYGRLLNHEFGHSMGMAHSIGRTGNDVPLNNTTFVSHNMMSNKDYQWGGITMSLIERNLLNWTNCTQLNSSQIGISIGGFFSTGTCYKISSQYIFYEWPPNAPQAYYFTRYFDLFVTNLQRDSFFNQKQHFVEGSFSTDQGLKTTGLNIISVEGYSYDEIPADNDFIYSQNASDYNGDLFTPAYTNSKIQLTPWTRPNVMAYNYSSIWNKVTTPSWIAIDNIRYTQGSSGEMKFDYISDFRTNPQIREDSWIGSESNNTTISGDITVHSGVILTIEDNITLNFSSGKGIIVKNGGIVKITGDNTLVNAKIYTEGTGVVEINSGNSLQLSENLQIPSGKELKITGGGNLKFASGKKILVSGSLTASNVTFQAQSGTWGGIEFNSGSTGSISNTVIKQVSGGGGGAGLKVYGNGINVTLDNTEIDIPTSSFIYGAYAYNPFGGATSTLTIKNSTIRSSSGNAVYASGKPSMTVNLFQTEVIQNNSNASVYSQNGSIYFWPGSTYPYMGYDKIKGGRLLASSGGGIYAGYGASQMSGNHFCNTASSSLEASSGGVIYANSNYWYSGPSVNTSGGGTVYHSVATSGSLNCSGVSKTEETKLLSSNETGKGTSKELFEALEQLAKGNTTEAISLLKTVMQAEDMVDAKNALLELGKVAINDEAIGRREEAFLKVISKQNSSLKPLGLTILVELYASSGRTREALEVANEIYNAYPGSYYAFNVSLIEAQINKNPERLLAYKEAIASDVSLSEEVRYGQLGQLEAVLSGIEGASESFYKSLSTKQEKQQSISVTTYPNPFNPTTTLSISMPKGGLLKVYIYDALGREVALLLDEYKEEGVVQVQFDGKRFASGTYFYRVEGLSEVVTGELLLIK